MAGSEVLKATKRTKVGTRDAKKLRAAGRIPANLQGDGKSHVDFSIDASNFLATRRHHTHLYDIDIDGSKEAAVVEELQWDVFGEQILHIEFKRVTRGKKTEAHVAIEFVGKPKVGVLNHITDELQIICLPSEIPDSIEVRVGHLAEGAQLFARDIDLPAGIELDMAGDTPICSVAHGTVEPEVKPEEGEGPAIVAPPP